MPKAIPEYVYSQREANIIDQLRTPATIKELSDRLSLSYHAARRHIKELELKGKVVQAPWPRDNSVVYMLTNVPGAERAIPIQFGRVTKAISQLPFMVNTLVSKELGNSFIAVVKHYCEHMKGQANLTPTGYPSISRCRDALIEIRRIAEAIMQACDQMISLPIWTEETGHDAMTVLQMIGDNPQIAELNNDPRLDVFLVPGNFDKFFPEQKGK